MQSLRNLLLLGGLPFVAAPRRAVVGRREKSLVAVFCSLLSFSALAQDDEYAREAERAAKGDPEHMEIQFHLAVALVEAGNRTRARRILERVVASDFKFAARPEAERLLKAL